MGASVIASEAKQSRVTKQSVDCFVASLLAMTAEMIGSRKDLAGDVMPADAGIQYAVRFRFYR